MEQAGTGMGDILARAVQTALATGKARLIDLPVNGETPRKSSTNTGNPGPTPPKSSEPENSSESQPGETRQGVQFLGDPCPHCGEIPPPEPPKGGMVLPERCQCRSNAEKDERIRQLYTAPASPEGYRFTCSRAKLPAHTPPGLAALELDESNREAIAACQQLVENFRAGMRDEWLWIHGPVGVGKTSLSLALCFDLWRNTGAFHQYGWKVNWGTPAMARWWNVPHFFTEWKKTFDNQPSKYDRDEIEKTDCLILDEFGNERATEFNISSLFEIVNHRYENRKSLVICSNYSPITLGKNIAKLTDSEQGVTQMRAMLDRVRQYATVIEIHGRSRRAPKENQR